MVENRDTINDDNQKRKQETLNNKNVPLWKYLKSELTRGYDLDQDSKKYAQKREKVYKFLRLPLPLERLMIYGFFQCADAFLYICTFLPIRVIMALWQIAKHPSSIFYRTRNVMTPAQIIDVCKGIVVIFCCLLLTLVDTSMVYHIIRGQAIIKLYIFFNMLEIADRLLTSVGQDILDALFWTATEPRNAKTKHFGVIPHLVLAVIYVFFHSLLVLCQTTTLNVAFNSHNKSLLTIMMSNNFIELKGNVFKKFDKNNFFQMSCSDIRERFHYFILLLMVCVRNMAQFDWDANQLQELVPMFMVIFFSEIFIDWIKHAFIVKFNDISSEAYGDYTLCLAYDMAKTKQNNALTDHSDLLSRRMGFIPLPLFCLLFRICSQSMKFSTLISYINLLVAFLCLISLKLLIGITLLGVSYIYIDEHTAKREQMRKEQEKKEQEKLKMLNKRHSINLNSINIEDISTTKTNKNKYFIINRRHNNNDNYKRYSYENLTYLNDYYNDFNNDDDDDDELDGDNTKNNRKKSKKISFDFTSTNKID